MMSSTSRRAKPSLKIIFHTITQQGEDTIFLGMNQYMAMGGFPGGIEEFISDPMVFLIPCDWFHPVYFSRT
jgi:hypothetical protein